MKDVFTGLLITCFFLLVGAVGGCLDGNSTKLTIFFLFLTGACVLGIFKLNKDEILDQFR